MLTSAQKHPTRAAGCQNESRLYQLHLRSFLKDRLKKKTFEPQTVVRYLGAYLSKL